MSIEWEEQIQNAIVSCHKEDRPVYNSFNWFRILYEIRLFYVEKPNEYFLKLVKKHQVIKLKLMYSEYIRISNLEYCIFSKKYNPGWASNY